MTSFKTSDGLNLSFDSHGDGIPVLCLAGLTRNRDDFDPILAARASACRFIRLDARGRGASDHAPDPLTYDVQTEARDVLELMDHLGLEKAAILGTSRGGLLAMTIAAVAPDRLSGVFFNDVGPELDLDGLKFIADYVGRAPAAKTHAEMAAGLAKLNEGVVEGLTLADWETVSRRTYVEDSNGLKLRYDPGLRESVLAAVSTIEAAGGSAELWPFYESLAHVPVAVLRGANSNILSHATLKDMAARHPDCQIAEVPGRGHVPFLDEAESLSLFDHWLERVRA